MKSMDDFTGFVDTTGECLGSCGGDSISGHAQDCEIGQAAAELADLKDRLSAAEENVSDYKILASKAFARLETRHKDFYLSELKNKLAKARRSIAAALKGEPK